MKPTISLALAFLLLLLLPAAAAEPLVHVVEKGETVYAIAREYKVSPEAILTANRIADPARITVGQKLTIPQVHVVAKGETLYGIAKAAGLGVDELRALNSLGPDSVLRVGQVLLLPASKTAASSSGKVATTGGTATTPVATGGGKSAGGTAQPAPGPVSKPSGSQTGAATGQTTKPSDGAAFPPLVKTSSRAVDPSLAWPCKGEARYLDGKIEGIMFLTERGVSAKAVASGTVKSAGPYRGFGQVVFVQSKSGYIYVYAGNDSLSVGMGDQVKVGQEIGKVGFDAKEGRAAAYFFVFKNGQSLDPARVPRG